MTQHIHYPKGQPMTTTPDQLLLTKMNRMALQILATAEPRSTVTSAAAELVMEDVSLASPKLRRELLDDHLEALDWLLKDAFKSQAPTATFSTDPVPESVTDLEGIKEAVGKVLTQNRSLKKLVLLQHAELEKSWDHGYVCGASDHVADPIDSTYLGISNPYTLEAGDGTP